MISLIAGVIAGFIVSIPPLGPISFALISKGIKSEIKEGLSIAIGSAFMDFVYCMIAFGGISLAVSLLPVSLVNLYSDNSRSIQIFLIYTGCALVVIYGIKVMGSKISMEELESRQSRRIHTFEEKAKAVEERAFEFAKQHHVPVANKANYGGLFLMGVLLCISSITLPASWVAVVGYLKGYNVIDNSLGSGVLFSTGAFLGTSVWFYTLMRLVTGNKHRINPSTVNKLNVAAGIILIILGIILFVKATLTLAG